MKKILIFGSGFIAGVVYVVAEIVREKLIVTNHLEGGVSIQHRLFKPKSTPNS